MVSNVTNRQRRFFVALLIGGILGAVVGLWIKYGLLGDSTGAGDTPGAGVPDGIRDGVAWQYARALQEGNWPRAVELTLWMEERLAFVAQSGTPEDVAAERETLAELLGSRSITENSLSDEGVEDQYVFAPGAQVDYRNEDGGREGLEAPVARRTWFSVTYPTRDKSLLDSEGIPIRSIAVGVNVSSDGRVLKAGVIGNLDLDWDSIQYNWPSP